MGKREYTAEQAYRKSVRPLAVFFVFGGLLFFVISLASDAHIYFSSFVQSDVVKRTLFGGVGILCMFIGLGLYRRSRLAWYVMFAYIIVGTGLVVLVVLLDETMYRGIPPLAEAVLAIAFNGVIGVGLYFATKPAFSRGSQMKCDP